MENVDSFFGDFATWGFMHAHGLEGFTWRIILFSFREFFT